jgi:hypothetical protein
MAKWHQFLVGNKFFNKTNHTILEHLFTQRTLIEEPRKWISQLQAYAFKIIYEKDKKNIVGEALSLQNEPLASNSILVRQSTWIQEVAAPHRLPIGYYSNLNSTKYY